MLVHNDLISLLSYDPYTGVLRWERKISKKIVIGAVAGSVNPEGYIQVRIYGRNYRAHRLIWFYVHGVWPDSDIDHINTIKHDNRISNLRLCCKSQNNANRYKQKNNTTGYKGVYRYKKSDTYYIRVVKDRKVYYDSGFNSVEEAAKAYNTKMIELYGEFARTNNIVNTPE